jgi:hypothetical protein
MENTSSQNRRVHADADFKYDLSQAIYGKFPSSSPLPRFSYDLSQAIYGKLPTPPSSSKTLESDDWAVVDIDAPQSSTDENVDEEFDVVVL